MNFEISFNEIEKDLEKISERQKKLSDDFEQAKIFTAKFLSACSRRKIKLVSIGEQTDLIKSSKEWSFGHSYSVFSEENDRKGFPKIWDVVSEMGISGGCGNSNQHQISSEGLSRLINGVYEFSNGKWYKK